MLVGNLFGCSSEPLNVPKEPNQIEEQQKTDKQEDSKQPDKNTEPVKKSENNTSKDKPVSNTNQDYQKIEVGSCNLSGYRKPNAVVDIGYGSREYLAYTNEYGQLVRVVAKEVIPQNDSSEDVTSKGRYCGDEAKVPGVESSDLDEGHVIADSLGGVSNAYNITPQDSGLNRYGEQADMEEEIREAGGCTNFVATITYPNTKTQTPARYSYSYTINGRRVNKTFDNESSSGSDYYEGSSQGGYSGTGGSSGGASGGGSAPSSNTGNKNIVYWTPKGKSYHSTPNCRTLSRSKTILKGTIEESGKYDPCDVCIR